MEGMRFRAVAFVLEGLNSISATLYFYFVYWFLKDAFGFGSRENLFWAVGHGVIYVAASIYGGRYAQRRGYWRALQVGFGGLTVAYFAGWLADRAAMPRDVSIGVQAAVMVVATIAICFTWPSLEALVSEGESGRPLQRNIGIYNLVWSGAGAATFFSGGALIEWLGQRTVVFLIPAVLVAGQWLVAARMGRWTRKVQGEPPVHGELGSESERRRGGVDPRVFLRMAWLANPCAYVAINTAVPLIPTLAERLGLGPREAGFFCSIWLFVRTAMFVGLWQWNGWHYRFRWLAGAFVGMILGFLFIFVGASFAGLGRGESLAVVTSAQVLFGVCIGLIYYSSLYYSMDVGDTKGDHGGIHEAAIGAGILAGPLVGGAAQWLRPGGANVAAWAVSVVLLVGFGVMAGLWAKGRNGRGTNR